MERVRRAGPTVAVLALALCGACERLPAAGREGAIVAGTAAAGRHPAVGALLDLAGAEPVYRCSGVLIAADALLTAAHCVLDLQPQLGFALGVDDVQGLTAQQLLAVASVEPHALYVGVQNAPNGVAQANDIAVVLLEHAASVDPQLLVRPAEIGDALAVDAPLALVGFGRALLAGVSGTKRVGAPSSLAQLGSHELEVGLPGEPQGCLGDSGGAVLADVDPGDGEAWRLVGVISRDANAVSPACADGTVATRIDSYFDFIGNNTTLPCGSGPRPPCADGGGEAGGPTDAAVLEGGGSAVGSGGGGAIQPAGVDGCAVGGGADGTFTWVLLAVLAWARRLRVRTDH